MNQQNKVSSQFVQDTIPQSIDNETQLKIEGATEMVAMYVKNHPRGLGKVFLIDVLNSYKARIKELNNDK